MTKKPSPAIDESPYVNRTFVVRLLVVLLIAILGIAFYEIVAAAFRVLLLVLAAALLSVLFASIGRLIRKILPLSRGWSVFIAVLLSLGLLAGFFFWLGPQVNQQLSQLQTTIPAALDKLLQDIQKLPLGDKIARQLQNPKELLSNQSIPYQKIANTIFPSLFGFLTDLFVILVVGLFFTANPHLYRNTVVRLLPRAKRQGGKDVFKRLDHSLRNWLEGKLLTMLIVAVGTAAGLKLLGVPLALILGLLAGILAFIPNIGPLLAQIPAVLIALMQGGSQVIWVLVLYNGLQLLESNLLLPLIMKQQVKIPPAFILIMQVLMGMLMGGLAIVMSVPLLVVLTVLIKALYLEGVLGESEPTVEKDKD